MAGPAGTHRGDTAGVPVEMADLRYDAVPAIADQLPRIRRALTAWGQQIGVSTDHVSDLVLATYEAMANVVSHAYPRHRGTFDMHAAYRCDQRNVTITVSDRGHWQPPPTNPAAHRATGLQLIRALATHTSVDPGTGGTTVEMSWSLP